MKRKGFCVTVACAVISFGACQSKPQPQAPAPPAAQTPQVKDQTQTPPPEDPSAAVESAAAESEDLATEAPEDDPASQTVKLKLEVAPRSARAVVWWGKQKLGEPPLTIERPRRSGPMNLVIKADGFLDHHTRLFTDRDDRLSLSLVRPNDAVGMLGYKRRPGQGQPAAPHDEPVPKVDPVPAPVDNAPAPEVPQAETPPPI